MRTAIFFKPKKLKAFKAAVIGVVTLAVGFVLFILNGCGGSAEDTYAGFWQNSVNKLVSLEIAKISNDTYEVAITNIYSPKRGDIKRTGTLLGNGVLAINIGTGFSNSFYNEQSKILRAPGITPISSDFVKVSESAEIARIQVLQQQAMDQRANKK